MKTLKIYLSAPNVGTLLLKVDEKLRLKDANN